MTARVIRREFLAALAGAATWPLAARAQQGDRMRRIGALMGVAERDPEGKAWVSAFRTALQQSGWIEGRNLQIDFRWPAADIAVMATHAEELVELKPDVILSHASPATAAIRKATRAIANVFVVVADPVGSGFVESFSRPGGNSTGFTNFEQTIGSKWLELLKELAPQMSRVATLFNPVTLPGGNNSVEAATASFKVSAIRSPFRDADDMKNVFAAFEREPTGLIVFPDTSRRCIVG
jgi:putative tryptophan/tyrosine transport system substrate-binding protein